MKKARILYGATEFGGASFSADILWRSRFHVPDPVYLVEIEDVTFILVSALEFSRAVKETERISVVLSGDYSETKEGKKQHPLIGFLFTQQVTHVILPPQFPYGIAIALRESFEIELQPAPFYPERLSKEDREIEEIVKVQHVVEQGIEHVRGYLSGCRVKDGFVVDGENGQVTSEILRSMLENWFYSSGCLGTGTIVSCGRDAADPHSIGAGPIRAGEPIVIDAFPMSLKSHYYADCTRTLFKGEPGEGWRKMYEAVRSAQAKGLHVVKTGISGSEVHKVVSDFLLNAGYPTNISAEKIEGFFHSTGHGVGLELHELPHVGSIENVLPGKSVITVEPGLYYPNGFDGLPAGGIRLEDMVLVRGDGYKSLTKLPTSLEWAIIP